MKRVIMLLILVPFLSSCLIGYVKPDKTHQFRLTVSNETSKEIKYKYRVSDLVADKGMVGLEKGGTLKMDGSIDFFDIVYGKMQISRDTWFYLLISDKVYFVEVRLMGIDPIREGDFVPNFILTDTILEYVDSELAKGVLPVPVWDESAKFSLAKGKDPSYFD